MNIRKGLAVILISLWQELFRKNTYFVFSTLPLITLKLNITQFSLLLVSRHRWNQWLLYSVICLGKQDQGIIPMIFDF